MCKRWQNMVRMGKRYGKYIRETTMDLVNIIILVKMDTLKQ